MLDLKVRLRGWVLRSQPHHLWHCLLFTGNSRYLKVKLSLKLPLNFNDLNTFGTMKYVRNRGSSS